MQSFLVTIKVLFPIFILFISAHKKIPLFISLIISGFASGFLFDISFSKIAFLLGKSFIEPDTVSLVIVVGIIQSFNEILGSTGRLKALVDSLKQITHRAFVRLAFFPVLIGLLPVPGGAVFSAPMVMETARDQNLEPHHLALVNYWFRHVFEYTWPLYPSLIVLSGISGYKLMYLSVLFFPVACMSLFSGWFFLIRGVKSKKTTLDTDNILTPASNSPLGQKNPYIGFFQAIWPLILMISLFFIQERLGLILLPVKCSSMICSLLIVIFLQIIFDFKNSLKGIGSAFSKASFYSMLFSIVAIMFFKAVIETGASPVLVKMFSANTGAMIFITGLLPFLSGLALGYGPGVVGSAFPVVYNFVIQTSASQLSFFIIISFCCGFMGVLLSPAHLCLTISKEYFGASTSNFYKLLVKIVALLFFLITMYSAILYFFAVQ